MFAFMTFEIAFVLLSLLGMVIALILDKMRPGMILFSVVVLFLCAGILTPKEMLEGFSNKGMITVALLFWSVKVSGSRERWGRLSRSCFLRNGRRSSGHNYAYCLRSLLFPLF